MRQSDHGDALGAHPRRTRAPGRRVNNLPGNPPGRRDVDLMLALHAWRSAASIARFKTRYPDRPLIVALTGTDLYHYLAADPRADPALARSGGLPDRPARWCARRPSGASPRQSRGGLPVCDGAGASLADLGRCFRDSRRRASALPSRSALRGPVRPGRPASSIPDPDRAPRRRARIRSGPIGLGKRWRKTRVTGGSGTSPAPWSGAG